MTQPTKHMKTNGAGAGMLSMSVTTGGRYIMTSITEIDETRVAVMIGPAEILAASKNDPRS